MFWEVCGGGEWRVGGRRYRRGPLAADATDAKSGRAEAEAEATDDVISSGTASYRFSAENIDVFCLRYPIEKLRCNVTERARLAEKKRRKGDGHRHAVAWRGVAWRGVAWRTGCRGEDRTKS